MARKSIAQISIFFIILISVATWYLLNNTGGSDGSPLEMIPSNVALIIEADNPGELKNKINIENPIFKELLEISTVKAFNDKIVELDSLVSDDVLYSKLLSESQATIAIFNDSTGGSQIAIFSKIGKNLSIASLKNYLETKLNRDYGVLDISRISEGFKIVDAGSGITQYIAVFDGVLVYTKSSDLLIRIFDTHGNKIPNVLDTPEFLKLQKSSGSRVHGRVYIQYSEFFKLIQPLVSINSKVVIEWLGNFAQWTEFDVLLKNNELILSGFTLSDSISNHASSFVNQKPVNLRALNILPYNTNTMLWLGLSDFSKYYYTNYSAAHADGISKKLNYNINELINVVGEELVFASNAETTGSYEGNSWFAIKVKNEEKAKSILNRIALNLGYSKKAKHNNYSIGRIKDANFLPSLFGDAFVGIKNNYYTLVGGYVVFANSENSLINLIGYFETGKTLDLNDNFKNFSDNIASKSNLLIYVKPGGILRRINQYFETSVSREMELVDNVIKSFQGLSFQLAGGNNISYTNIYTNHARGVHEENLALWKVLLKGDIVFGPFLVADHQTKSKNILVFDKLNIMYFVNADGNIVWDRKVDSKPVSDVFEVDFFKNNKIQYLFNTGDYIYLVDRNGRDVQGYPKKLHKKATNGIVIFDYLKNKDYRLLLAQSDKKIYNYSIAGKEIKGWNQPKMQNIVVAPVERLLANKKDYIIITDIENEIKIVDRKGKRRIKVSTDLKKAKNSSYYVNRTNSKGIIITTTEAGKLVYISASGKLNYTDFGNFSQNHFFLYEDFNGDKSNDFIFIDGNNLQVFDRFKKVLFSYDFGSDITIAPSFFKLGRKQHVLGVVADQERTIYLFDKKGNIIISKGLVSETQFNVGDLQNDGKINLVSAAGNTLYNYRLR